MAERLVGDEDRVGDHAHPRDGASDVTAFEPARPLEREGQEQQRQPERHHRLHERARQCGRVDAHGAPDDDERAANDRQRQRNLGPRSPLHERGARDEQIAGRHPQPELEEAERRPHVEHAMEPREIAVDREEDVQRDEGDDERAREEQCGADAAQGDEEEREQQVVLHDQEHEPE